MKHIVLIVVGCLLGLTPLALGAPPDMPKASLVSPLVWSDEKGVVRLEKTPPGLKEVAFSIQTIQRTGWGPTQEGTAAVREGQIEITPLTEGIHIVALKPLALEVRFLAMRPPLPLGKTGRAALLRALPRRGPKLLSGQKFTLLAMGDSVTATGDYPQMLAMLLARATGNTKIEFLKRAYSGRSIDATVRHWPDDTRDIQPDLGLLMYGLNDQVTFYPLDAYLEQYRWVAQQMTKQFAADTVFLQPTPDISFPLDEAARKPDSNPSHFAFRTIGFGESLRPLSSELKVPLAETFGAVWGQGGPTIEDAARRLWPIFPPGYSRQFNSLLETDGKGDTIHLNALGHLSMAHAVFDALIGQKTAPPLHFTARSRWTAAGVQSLITLRNASKLRLIGHVEVHPLLRGELQGEPIKYDLGPGKTTQFEVSWPQAKVPSDLLTFPNDHYLAPGRPLIPVLDVADGGSHVYAVTAPFEVDARFARERQIVQPGQVVKIGLFNDGKRSEIPLRLPEAAVGALPLLQKVERQGKTGWAAAEVRFTRFGAAPTGETTIDGDLAEWQEQTWVPMGEPFQARYSTGPRDFRAAPREAYLHWAFKAGKDGLFLAARGQGQLQNDNFTLFFDPRAPEKLGTVGRYYWLDGKLQPDGKIQLRKGETSREAPGMSGTWRQSDEGLNLELFVPYALFEKRAWPPSGDLGLSLWWVHSGPDGKKTNLMWSEEGHPWNPRWYGVVRHTNKPDSVPFMVRVK